MRSPKRIPKILKELELIWKLYPNLRLGQLIFNLEYVDNIYNMEDEQLIKILRKYYNV